MLKSTDLLERNEWTPERVGLVGRNIGIAIGGGILLGLFAVVTNLWFIAAAIGAALLVVLIAWHFETALALYALVAFVPWGRTPDMAVGGSGVGKGMYVSELMLGFLLVVWLGKYLLQALPRERISAGFYAPLGLYLAYSVLNVVNSYLFWDPHVNKMYQHLQVNIAELGIRFLSAGAMVMFATSITSRKWLTWATVMVMVPGVYCMLNALAGGPIPITAPWWPLIAIFPVCYCLIVVLRSVAKPALRFGSAAMVAGAFVAILVKNIAWVSGWLGLFVSMGTLVVLKSRRLFAIGLAIVAIVTILNWGWVHQKVFVASEGEGDYDRFALAAGAWKYATHFPLGVGIGNYRTYNSFYYGELWGTTGYTSAHGTYSQLLSEMGIPGFIIFLAMLILGFRWMFREYGKMRMGPSKDFMLAAMAQLVGISVAAYIGDYIIPSYHNGGLTTFSATVYSWIIWGLAIAHVRINSAEERNLSALGSQP